MQDYITDFIKTKSNDANNRLAEFVQSILNRKSVQISVTQQLKHIFQWVIDVSLYTLNQITNTNQQHYYNQPNAKIAHGFNLTDINFLNDLRKCLVYIKLLVTYTATSPQPSNTSQHTLNSFIYSSLPVLPVRSTLTKDVLNDLFNIYTKIVQRLNETASLSIDDALVDQCLSVQAETIARPIDELLLQLKCPWIHVPATHVKHKCLNLSVDQLFAEEKLNRKNYPLFDLTRLVYFSRSEATRQCIRCGNYTESGSSTSKDDQTNSIKTFDLGSDKCVCNGLWVLGCLV
jgi:hypothetical protein